MIAEFGCLFDDLLFSCMVSISPGYDFISGKYPLMGQRKSVNIQETTEFSLSF